MSSRISRGILSILLIMTAILFSAGSASAAYHANNTYLDVYFGEISSNTWNFMYAPGIWGDACYLEHFGIYTDNWGGTKSSDYDFSLDGYFEASPGGRTAYLHYDDLNVTREVYLPSGEARHFSINYTLRNDNPSEVLRDVRLFEVVDYDIVTSGGSYGWYARSTDSVWQNNDEYFRNGFGGDRPSSNHGMEYYSFETSSDWSDGVLNGLDKYPEDGTADVAVGMQWNLSDLGPGESWNVSITFEFGGSAGIYVDAGPHRTVGAGRPVVLDASRSESVGRMISYEWDINGDGIYEINASEPLYTYEGWQSPGEHNVTLRATDDAGRNATSTVVITVISGSGLDIEGTEDTFTIGIAPDSFKTSPGGRINFTVSLTNDQAVPDSFNLSADGIDPGWITLDEEVALSAGASAESPLKVSVPEDAMEAAYNLTLSAASYNLGGSINRTVHLDVSNAPEISDLQPEDGTRTGSDMILVSWKTPVSSTGDLFIRAEGETDYTRIAGALGQDHAIQANLSRDTLYEYYVRSETAKGVSESPVRNIFIDSGIAFTQKVYDFTIERDYNQSRFITVKNTDTEPHELLLQVSGVPADLALNFVGEGSMDQRIPLLPGESKDVELVFHAQDAVSDNYTILLNLTNLGPEAITDSAVLRLGVHFPVIDYAIEEVSSDPYTLAKTLRITNRGDPLTDLSVSGSNEIKSLLTFEPSVDHAYLGTGASLDFTAEPLLTEGFTGAVGTIVASAAGTSRNLSSEFAIPPGKRIFVGHQPNVSIVFSPDFDNDGIPNTNPAGEVNSYLFKSGGSEILGFLGQIKVRAEQDGLPVSNATVALILTGPANTTTTLSQTDLWGTTVFSISGPAGEYSYQASVQGYGAATETGEFSVKSTPSRTIEPSGVRWVSASDAQATYDLAALDSTVTLNSPPFTIRAAKDGLIADTVPVLYLTNVSYYNAIEVIGRVEGDNIIFNLDYADPGLYVARIGTQSAEGLATSPMRLINFSAERADVMKQGNYTYEMPFPAGSGQALRMSINNSFVTKDLHKFVRLVGVLPDENKTSYVFTYLIASDIDSSDTLRISAKDSRGNIIFEDEKPVTLNRSEPLFATFAVPATRQDGSRVEEFSVDVRMDDPIFLIAGIVLAFVGSAAYIQYTEPGALADGATWSEFWNNGMLTPHTYTGVTVKCIAGFIPGLNWPLGLIDTINNAFRGEFIQTCMGAFQAGADPGLDIKLGSAVRGGGAKEWEFWKIPAKYRELMQGAGSLRTWSGFKEQTSRVLREMFVKPMGTGGLERGVTGAAWAVGIISNFMDLAQVVQEQQAQSSQSGLVKSQSISVRSCINHAPLKNTVKTPGYIPRSVPAYPSSSGMPGRYYVQSIDDSLGQTSSSTETEVQNIDGVYVRLFFAREVPSSYRPFNTSVSLNGHLIGLINGTVPQGSYVFRADPSYLNFAEKGNAENTVTLDVYGMNRGYYVPLEGYKIDILFKSMSRAVCAASQDEADRAVMDISGTMSRDADLSITTHSIRIMPANPALGENVTIEATVKNVGSRPARGIVVQIFDGDEMIQSEEILYMPEYSEETLRATVQAAAGSHTIKVRVNPDRSINESDFGNNEASRSFPVSSPGSDSQLPSIGNMQPPDSSELSYNRPLLSADLSDDGSGINVSSVRMTLDGQAAAATAIPTRVWFTPAQPLESGRHEVRVEALDMAGNPGSITWSFTISLESSPPQIVDPQPPDGTTVEYGRPLLSAVFRDNDSGVETSSVAVMLDGTPVTSRSRVIPTKVWYTPEEALAAGVHRVTVRASDSQGNSGELSWSFTVSPGGTAPAVSGNVTVCQDGCDHSSIQDAVNAARAGTSILVRNGTYRESVNIDKPMRLIGTGRPVVDSGRDGNAIILSADNITLAGFRATGSLEAGIESRSNNSSIVDNVVDGNGGNGIYLNSVSGNIVKDNLVSQNGFGIYLGGISANNTLVNNTARDNDYGIYIDLTSNGNLLFLNNLFENRDQNAYDLDTGTGGISGTNLWDNGTIGNYYGDMECSDSNGDGICDREYVIPGGIGTDRYPRRSAEVMSPGLPVGAVSGGSDSGGRTSGSSGTLEGLAGGKGDGASEGVSGVAASGITGGFLEGDLIYSDDFSDPARGWLSSVTNTEDVAYFIAQDRFYINVIAEDTIYSSSPGHDYSDLEIEVEAKKESGSDNDIHGIILRRSADSYYAFGISADGYYCFNRFEDGMQQRIIGWTASGAIHTGRASNVIMVRAEGDRFTFFVNDVQVDEVRDGTFDRGDIGLFAGVYEPGGISVSFDNLSVRSVEGGGSGTSGSGGDNSGVGSNTAGGVIVVGTARPVEEMRLIDHGMATDPDDLEGSYADMILGNEFYPFDAHAVSWLRLGPISGPHDVQWEWYSPDGNLYDITFFMIEGPLISDTENIDQDTAYSYIDIEGSDAEHLTGDWWVDVYLDGEYLYTEDFIINDEMLIL